jgi:hypothetical protein
MPPSFVAFVTVPVEPSPKFIKSWPCQHINCNHYEFATYDIGRGYVDAAHNALVIAFEEDAQTANETDAA